MELNKFIDHTLLKPDATENDIKKLCEEAIVYNFASVCVASCWEQLAKASLNSDVKLCVVRNFPHGNSVQIDGLKIHEASEIDYVLNIGFVKSGMWEEVKQDIWSMRYMGGGDRIIKVIVEVGYLTDYELFRVTNLLIVNKIDFIKTCTGYGPRNVTIEDVIKIKKHVGNQIKIKASGGIKTAEFAKQLIEAGADRIGTSSGVSIMNEISKQGENIHATSESNVAGY